MGKEESKLSNTFGPPYKLLMPEDVRNSKQTSGTTLDSFNAGAGSYFGNFMLPNQASGTPLPYGFLHDPRRFSNNPLVPRDFPSTKQQCNAMIGNGKFYGSGFVFGYLIDEVSRSNSTEQNQNWGTCLKATGSIAQFSKQEEDEIRKERKRQSNRESAKRSRKRKQQECEELRRNMDVLKDENSKLTQRLMRLSEDCLEVSTENDSIEEELVKMYGPESIADLLPMKPASGGSQTTVKEES
ncbi:hypothetical protein RIF29_15162 [Crotalaria pallida]|uniref:BZIP domain-containing protein n=1 Tax=Crotalaria pallida TaxID=3830 RepID=A0AAN9IEE3_CROPI